MELSSTDQDLQTLFSLETLLEMLEKVGYRGNPCKSDMKSKAQVMSSNIIEGIKTVCFFFKKRFHTHIKAQKVQKAQKAQNVNK